MLIWLIACKLKVTMVLSAVTHVQPSSAVKAPSSAHAAVVHRQVRIRCCCIEQSAERWFLCRAATRRPRLARCRNISRSAPWPQCGLACPRQGPRRGRRVLQIRLLLADESTSMDGALGSVVAIVE